MCVFMKRWRQHEARTDNHVTHGGSAAQTPENHGRNGNNYIPMKKPYNHATRDQEYLYLTNSRTWRNLRLWYLKRHPVCENCELHGRTRQAVEVHHITPVQRGATFEEKKALCYNPQNLRALCRECHHEEHNTARLWKKGAARAAAHEETLRFVNEWLTPRPEPGKEPGES